MSVSVQENSSDVWSELWSKPETRDWRADVLRPIYERIQALMPFNSKVIDVGGGVGALASYLNSEGHSVEVWEHNEIALGICSANGIDHAAVNLENMSIDLPKMDGYCVVATEVLEHLSDRALERVLRLASASGKPCFFSVPNDRLTPKEEPQHARSWTALSFLNMLREYWPEAARVEVLGPPAQLGPAFPSDHGQPAFLLGVCGIPKKQTVSVCWPARDEAADIEKCLASFRGFADQMVIGIDPRTKDKTREIAKKYAEVVFDLTELQGPPEDRVPGDGFHFAHARNQCMDRCTQDWIFMTEAHEPIVQGQDLLLHLEAIPDYVQVAQVVRTGGRPPYREQWLFPWLCKNRRDIRYKRSTHNTLEYGDHPIISLPQIATLHERVHERSAARRDQRKVQNRVKLMEDWVKNKNSWSLHYLGSEWREYDPERSVRYFREYLAVGGYGVLRYHTRLLLAQTLTGLGRIDEAREVLHAAAADDWCRIEHFIALGDLAFEEEQYEQALTFYGYACTKRGNPPLMTWWVSLEMYSWIPAERMAMTHAALGNLEEALHWGKAVRDDFLAMGDDEALKPFIKETEDNIAIVEEAISARDHSMSAS